MEDNNKKEDEIKNENNMSSTNNADISNECICSKGNDCTCKDDELKKLKDTIIEMENKLKYNQAELINYRKRKDEETANMLKFANQDLILELIPIADNFERAIKFDDYNLNDELSKFLSGFKMIYTNLLNILDGMEVKVIDCQGLEFDPNKMEAVLTEKDENLPANVVLEVLQKGYIYKDKVIRVAMVKENE